MKTISILNLKGGVGKTFTAVNMAYELHRRGYNVLLIDNDKQGNLSKAYGRYDADTYSPAARMLSGDWQQADELIQCTDYKGIDIITANMARWEPHGSLQPARKNCRRGDTKDCQRRK